jgi:predicted dehydrogenase
VTLTAVLVGAGNRGRWVYGRWALAHPERLRIVAVAEPNDAAREAFAAEHAIAPEHVHRDWSEVLDGPRRADVAIIATGDTLHTEPALAAIERGYHLLLEKPIAPTPAECVRVVESAERAGLRLQIGHVLRYSRFYEKVHEIVSGGAIGEIVHVDMKEHVAHWHMAHSYVRGKFRNRAVAAPILLAKSCHDLDLMAWLVDRPALRVASFGARTHYRPERAPAGAPPRCSDGCPVQERCPHDAVAFYAGPDDRIARGWPWSDVSTDPSRAARMHALETGRYGRCVFHCDNDVLDHQTVAIEFEGGVTASFGLQGLAAREQRTIRVTGSRGELRGVLDGGSIEVERPGVLGAERFTVEGDVFGHFGGDVGLVDHFVGLFEGGQGGVRASGRAALESHLVGFAAERAREEGRVVEMRAFRDAARAEAGIAPR